ncbi:hypothetical protein DRQ33_05405 [bacterium]|nr:MAG: hypothetical protein DRQ33_05405 [bacterium]
MISSPIRITVIFLILILFSLLYCDDVSSVYFAPGGCVWCWEYNIDLKFSGNSIAPHFSSKFHWIEFYFGANISATSEDLFATVDKYRTIDTFTYLAEQNAYSLDLRAYFIEPELGIKMYFIPTEKMSPYIDIGTFWAIPIFSYKYTEDITHYDTSGTVTFSLETDNEGKPSPYFSGLYQLGASVSFGLRYRPSRHIAIYGELGARGLFMGTDLKYEYISERVSTQSTVEEHLWSGTGDIWGITAGGAVGVQLFF